MSTWFFPPWDLNNRFSSFLVILELSSVFSPWFSCFPFFSVLWIFSKTLVVSSLSWKDKDLFLALFHAVISFPMSVLWFAKFSLMESGVGISILFLLSGAPLGENRNEIGSHNSIDGNFADQRWTQIFLFQNPKFSSFFAVWNRDPVSLHFQVQSSVSPSLYNCPLFQGFTNN